MRNLFSMASVFLLMSLTQGCVTTTAESFEEDGLTRASFDLSCPKDKLTTSIIKSTTSYMGRPYGTVGVSGCGKKAVYVNTVSGWVNNSSETK